MRNLSKGEAAKQDIEASTKRSGESSPLEVWQLDLASYDSVKQFAAKVTRDVKRLDVLVESAGVAPVKWSTAEDSESTITVNVISTFLLALLLLPKLRETATRFDATPHLCIVSSEVHFWSHCMERKYPSILAAVADKEKTKMSDR